MLRRSQRGWDHLLVHLGLREATDDWAPSVWFRVVVAAVGALIAYRFVAAAWETRGPLVGLVAAALTLWVVVGLARRGPRTWIDFAQRRPYADASFSIPIGLFTTLLIFPSWSVPLCLLVTALYVALIFILAHRRARVDGASAAADRA